MSSLSRLKASPSLLIRALVALGAAAGVVAAVASFAAGRPALGADVAEELVALVIVGALARRVGIAPPPERALPPTPPPCWWAARRGGAVSPPPPPGPLFPPAPRGGGAPPPPGGGWGGKRLFRGRAMPN